MNTAQPNNPEKLLTLKEASIILSVSIEVLLDWNKHNILKPTITPEGEIGYTQGQLDQFLTIRKFMQAQGLNPVKPEAPVQQTLPTPQPQVSISIPTPQPHAYYHEHDEESKLSRSSKAKTPSYIIVFSLVAVFVTLTLPVFPQENTKSSKLNLSEKIISALPIQFNEHPVKKNLSNEGESVTKEKIAAIVVPTTKPKRNITTLSASQTAVLAAKRKTGTGTTSGASVGDTFASSGNFEESCLFCKTTADSAIDEKGNIRGEAKTDTLATILGGIDQMIKIESLSQAQTDTTDQIIFFSLAALAIIFMFQRQLAYSPLKKTSFSPISNYADMPNPALQKALEVGQKTDGTVVLYLQGREYKISKPELNSESDHFIERLMTLTQPGVKEIEYDSLRPDEIELTTPLSRLVTRLGFVGMKRDLFFPRTSKNSVLFRKYLTQQDLDSMSLTADEILAHLDD